VITAKSFEKQLRSEYIGWSKEIKPVPKSGRVLFADIGNLTNSEHSGAEYIDLADDKAQQMLNTKGVKPIDPEDFRGAIWSWGRDLSLEPNQPPPEPTSWIAAFINDFSGSRSQAYYDASTDALCLVADTRTPAGQYEWNVYNETAAAYYVGRIPAGTKLKAEVSMLPKNDYRYGTGGVANIRGWSDGWFGNDDYHQYLNLRTPRAGDNEFVYRSGEFTVLKGWEDIWVTCEVLSNNCRYNPRDRVTTYYKDYKISLA
jgi:hypothetical protein